MKIRSYMALLIVLAITPMLFLLAMLIVRNASSERRAVERGMLETARALALAMDREIQRAIIVVEGLAASEHLDSGDLRRFHAHAGRIITAQKWLVNSALLDPSGRQLANLHAPFGIPLLSASQVELLKEVVKTEKPRISNLFKARLTEGYRIVMYAPVWREQNIKYVLGVGIDPTALSALLSKQAVPSGWILSITDGNHVTIARSAEAEKFVGVRVSPGMIEKRQSSEEGSFRSVGREGKEVYSAFTPLPISGWTANVIVPAAQVEASYWQSLYWTVSASVALFAISLALAWSFARKLALPITCLAAAAKLLGQEKPSSMIPCSPVKEVELLKTSINESDEILRARTLERDRVETELRKVNAELGIEIEDRKRAEKALNEADRRKDEFLAMLGHELRNPLGIISTSVQLLRLKGPPDPALTEVREMIARQTKHMSRMLDDLLDVSRITRGLIRLKHEPCDLVMIVQQMVQDHRNTLYETGPKLTSHVPDEPLWINGDPTRLAQIVGNLLYNASKFTDSDGTVTVRLLKTPGPSALLSIQDTGIGIEPEMLKQVFEPFTQADHSLDRSRGGLGLGLALVKGLVQLHGGEVRAESAGLGRGSEFTIRLPLPLRIC